MLGKIPSALEFLAGPNPTVTRSDHGQMVLDPDADPRNANWLRLAAAARLRSPLVTWGLEQRELATGIADVFAPES